MSRQTSNGFRSAGLLARRHRVYMVVQLNGQGTALTGNFTNAAAPKCGMHRGKSCFRDSSSLAEEDDDDTERKAALEPTGIDADAAGEAEVEFCKAAPATQEIEFSVSGLQPGATFTFVDRRAGVATATADRVARLKWKSTSACPGSRLGTRTRCTGPSREPDRMRFTATRGQSPCGRCRGLMNKLGALLLAVCLLAGACRRRNLRPVRTSGWCCSSQLISFATTI